MATTTTDTWESAEPPAAGSDNYLTHTRGIASWIFTLDHKRVGIMFLVSVTACLGLGAFFALLIRTELAHPGPDDHDRHDGQDAGDGQLWPIRQLTPQQMYNRAFTLHGAIMIFLFVIPAIPSALGNFILPLQLGAKDVAFPRLNLFSYHLFFLGAIFFVLTLLLGGVDTGWTFYAPYSVETSTAVTTAVIGAFLLGFRLDLHRTEFPGDGPHAAAARDDLVQDAVDGLVAVRHGDHPVAGHSGAGHHAGAAVCRAVVWGGDLRPGTGRRSGAVSALLLVLFAPGRVHHDSAGDGDHQRSDFGAQPQAHFWIQVHCLQQYRHRAAGIPGVGAPHVCQRPVAAGRRDLQRA